MSDNRGLQKTTPSLIANGAHRPIFGPLSCPLPVSAASAHSASYKVGHLARALGISLRTLERLTRTHTGRPPRIWLNYLRQHHAIELLAAVSAPKPSPTKSAINTSPTSLATSSAFMGERRALSPAALPACRVLVK